ncbi:MAG: hypothetical protein AAF222_03675 [Pseudomonadota bacterium]
MGRKTPMQPTKDKSEAPPELGRQKTFDASFLILLGIAVAAASGVAYLKGPGRVVEIALSYLGFLVVLTPKILCGFFVAAAVPILVPREQLTRWVGQESGLRGLVVATLAGAVVPGGPMMIFPLAASFIVAGARLPVVVAFVTAWSLYGLNRTIIWEMSFLQIEFVLFRVLICLPFPVLAGWLAGRVFR